MRSNLLNLWEYIKHSYWFIPTLLSLFAIILSLGAIELDARLGNEAPWGMDWLYNNQPNGARAVLSTIAGSMITVAGVVFSITLVTVSNAALQFGPRLLTNFMRDKTNQFTLGIFIATFIYCLLVLRAVQDAPSGVTDVDAAYFVPHIAVLIGIGFAMVSIAVLIRFIHHAPQSIHISLVTAKIGKELTKRIEERFPHTMGDEEHALSAKNATTEIPASLRDPIANNVVKIRAKSSGYVRVVAEDGLLGLAQDYGISIRLTKQPGDFVVADEVLMICPVGTSLDDAQVKALRATFALGGVRTPTQDIRFLIQELVEIGIRALSPGINDPVTAVSCMNWLASALGDLAKGDSPSAIRKCEGDDFVVVTKSFDLPEFLSVSFGDLRPYLATNLIAAQAGLDLLRRVSQMLDGDRSAAIMREHDLLKKAAKDILP